MSEIPEGPRWVKKGNPSRLCIRTRQKEGYNEADTRFFTLEAPPTYRVGKQREEVVRIKIFE